MDAIHPEERERSLSLWSYALETKRLYETEHRLQVADGTYRFFSVRGVPILDENGQIIEWVGTHTDISDRVSMQLALHQRAEELTEANRLKDEFLAVSHELRSPLNAMLGWLTLLRSRKFDEATTARALKTIERNARSQAQLVEDLLDISRIIRGQLRLNVRPV